MREPICRLVKATKKLTVGCNPGCDIQLPQFLLGLPPDEVPPGAFMTFSFSRLNSNVLIIRMEKWVKLGFLKEDGSEVLVSPMRDWCSLRRRCCLRRVEIEVSQDWSLNVYTSSDKDLNCWKHACQLQLLEPPLITADPNVFNMDMVIPEMGFQLPRIVDYIPVAMMERIFLSSTFTDIALGFAGMSRRCFKLAQWGLYYADVSVLRFSRSNPGPALAFLSILTSPGDSVVDLGMPMSFLEISNIADEGSPLTKPFPFNEMADLFDLMPNLKTLILGKGSICFRSGSKKFKFQALRELQMNWDCVGFSEPFPFNNFPLLHTVVLAIIGVRRFGHGHKISALRDLRHLKVLTIAELPLGWTWTVSKVIGLMNPGLEVLRIPFVNCTNEEFLDFLPERCPKLKQLELPGARVQFKNVVYLFSDIPSLEVVELLQPSLHSNKTENVLKLRHSRAYIAPNGPLGHKQQFEDILGHDVAQLVGNKYLLKNIQSAIQYGVPVRLAGEWRMLASDLNAQRKKWAVDGQVSSDADAEDDG